MITRTTIDLITYSRARHELILIVVQQTGEMPASYYAEKVGSYLGAIASGELVQYAPPGVGSSASVSYAIQIDSKHSVPIDPKTADDLRSLCAREKVAFRIRDISITWWQIPLFPFVVIKKHIFPR